MSALDLMESVLFLSVVVAVGVMAALLTSRLAKAPRGSSPRKDRAGTDTASGLLRHYRFRDGYLLSDIERDDAFLDPDTDRSIAYKRLVAGLSDISPDFAAHLDGLTARGEVFMVGGRIGDDPITVSGRLEDGGVLALSIGPSDTRDGRQVVETVTLTALQTELEELRTVLDAGIAPMWRQDAQNNVTWANAAYMELADRIRDDDAPSWPLPRLFAAHLEPVPNDGTLRRCVLEVPDSEEAHWYELVRDPMPDGSEFFTAHPVDRLVRSETSLREFMQTLTKTFASLPIGLAVFDKRRHLVTFNPSFVALTTIGADFLISRPDLRTVLDRLRDRQRMPEPRDYRSWREEIARLEEGAADGTYHEIWELPDNKAFRVIGRPHPDGAIAFMFEDISAEVSLTRQFRADLDLLQAVLDAAPAAIAIFGADGGMVGANQVYRQIWGDAGDSQDLTSLPNLTRSTALWAARCQPSGIWGEIRQFVAHDIERAPWVEEIETLDGTQLLVRMMPTRSRHTVVQFFPRDGAWADPLSDLLQDMSPPELEVSTPPMATAEKAARTA
ncbi:PAS-domain containing protein [Gymnodinialimonas sp. 2305UL16-5]|uniref:PAS-domain containing protein n=1 Tax=Gymnodinialimonas mytili TaxID=3126503 RepID=UPI003097BA84